MYPQGACRIRKAPSSWAAAQYFKFFKLHSWGKDPLITADNFISGYWGFVAADSTYTRYAFVRAPSSDRKSLAAGGAERSVGADDPVRPFPQASTAPCRGRCRAKLFATKERYRCGLPLAGTHRPEGSP